MKGYLYKRGPRRGHRWYRRWCTLVGDSFSYFVDESQKDPKGRFMLSRCDDAFPLTLPPNSLFPSHGFVFVIHVTSLRSFLFSAPSQESREMWIEAVRRTVRDVRGRMREERERKTLHLVGVRRRIELEKKKGHDRLSRFVTPPQTARLEKSAKDFEDLTQRKKMSSQKRKALNLESHAKNGKGNFDLEGEDAIFGSSEVKFESRHSWHGTHIERERESERESERERRRGGEREEESEGSQSKRERSLGKEEEEGGKKERREKEREKEADDDVENGSDSLSLSPPDMSFAHTHFPPYLSSSPLPTSPSPICTLNSSPSSSSSPSLSPSPSPSLSPSPSPSPSPPPSSLKEAKAALLFASRAASWSVEDVGIWICQIGLETFSEHFVSNCICGADLFELKDEELDQDLGIEDKVVRRKILRAIDILRLRYCEVEV